METTLDRAEILRAVDAALTEDLEFTGDVTTRAVLDWARRGRGILVARSDLVLAGLPVAREVFRRLDPELEFLPQASDGDRLAAGTRVATISGRARPILEGERTALNFLMRMCGIATVTRGAVDEIEGSGARILDTRKTAPGLRRLDKYAVACGGADNHRMGLFDAAMVKDTHLEAGCSIPEAVRRILASGIDAARITVEVRDDDELRQAIESGAGRALLDNMTPQGLRAAVALAKGRIVLEASGGLRPGRLREVAATGVDFLSLGWLTHSAPSADLAMDTETLA